MYADEDLPPDKSYPLTKYFEKDAQGNLKIKNYVPTCEFCDGSGCNRMMQKEDLDNSLRDLIMDEDLNNKQRRYYMYREWIHYKYDSLGPGERKEVHKCV